jgi:hypothetical protein
MTGMTGRSSTSSMASSLAMATTTATVEADHYWCLLTRSYGWCQCWNNLNLGLTRPRLAVRAASTRRTSSKITTIHLLRCWLALVLVKTSFLTSKGSDGDTRCYDQTWPSTSVACETQAMNQRGIS